MQLEPLPYHVAVAGHLERAEPALWSWFRSDAFAAKYRAETAKDLLRTAIRLAPAGANERRYQLARAARDKLGLAEPITLYQMQDASGPPNAFLVFTPGEIIVAFSGRILELLDTDPELTDLLGHEISHYKLYTEGQGRYHTADRLLAWLGQRDGCPPEFIETWRRNRLYTEIYCDIGGLIACGDLDATVRGLVKTLADFKDADAQSYLAQARQLMEAGPGATRGTTHPELHARVMAVTEALTTPAAQFHARLQALISGPMELGALDVVEQGELGRLTRQVLDRVLADTAARGEGTLAHARQMFNDYQPPAAPPGPLANLPQGLAASIADYLVYLLLDLGTAEGTSSPAGMAVAAAAADEMGLGTRFRDTARLELRGRRSLLSALSTRAA